MEIKGKTIFITGSTQGIGLGIARKFAESGANIVLNGRKQVPIHLIDEIQKMGVQCIGVSGDVSSFEDTKLMIEKIEKNMDSVSILVNNAGITSDKLLVQMSSSDFEKVLKTNLIGTFNVTKQIIKKTIKKKEGAIVNISSVSGLIGNIGQCNYAASKSGIIGFTKSVAREVASRGISINAIAPGFVKTEMTDSLPASLKDQLINTIPMKRFGSVKDIAQTVLFLVRSSYITGQVINVDGGLVMQG